MCHGGTHLIFNYCTVFILWIFFSLVRDRSLFIARGGGSGGNEWGDLNFFHSARGGASNNFNLIEGGFRKIMIKVVCGAPENCQLEKKKKDSRHKSKLY